MIGSLFKELFLSLGRFFRYHLTPAGKRNLTPLAAQHLSDPGLDPALLKTVAWPSHPEDTLTEELRSDPLYQLWLTKGPGGHKWIQYFSAYREVFEPIRLQPLRILEIGIYTGAGLRLWRSYFSHPDTLIVGIDIEPSCARFESTQESIHVRIGSQADADFLRTVVEEFGPFDVIIDDGSHKSSHILASFNHLYLTGLKETGIYLVEDLHANYWPDWRDSQRSFLDICKELVEHMHAHYMKAGPAGFIKHHPSGQPWVSLDVPVISTLIREIRFFDSIVVIHKTHRKHIPYWVQT